MIEIGAGTSNPLFNLANNTKTELLLGRIIARDPKSNEALWVSLENSKVDKRKSFTIKRGQKFWISQVEGRYPVIMQPLSSKREKLDGWEWIISDLGDCPRCGKQFIGCGCAINEEALKKIEKWRGKK